MNEYSEAGIARPSQSATTPRATKQSDRWLFVALLIIVALAPLPLGSNRPLPMAVLAGCTGALLLAWTAFLLTGKTRLHRASGILKWPAILFIAVCLWIIVQWSPWIPAQFADPVWQNAESLLGQSLRARISVNPDATLTGLMHLITYGSLFWLTFQLTQTSERAWVAIRALVLIGSAYALYGIIVFAIGNNWVLIYPKWAYPESLTSTFVNRNSYATFAGLAFLCAVTLLLNHLTPFFALNLPLRFKTTLIIEEIVAKAAWKTLVALAIALSLVLTGSRAGTFSTLVGFAAIITLYFASRKTSRKQKLYFTIFGVVLASVIFLASGNLISKRLTVDHVEANIETRNSVYASTWNAILTSPWKGTGLGTFADVFPAYRDPNNYAAFYWDKAHNTYLENALELGLPAAIALDLVVLLIGFYALRGALTRKREKMIPALGLGATLLVSTHSFVDFSLQIPAVTIFYACIAGLAVSQSQSHRDRNPSDSDTPPRR